jgi:c-di-GMP-binding flagellar brake protein YcgR
VAGQVERRRTPRVEIADNGELRLELRQKAQLVDISRSGVLVTCEATVPIGTRGHFRTGLGGLPFTAEVAVKRHANKGRDKGVAHGAAFGQMDERSARHLDQFLQRGKDTSRDS